MFVVDTNILVYGADERSGDHARCASLLNEWRSSATPWFLTWGIVYEFLRVVTHPKVLRKPWTGERAWGFILALLAGGSLRLLTPGERHLDAVSELLRQFPAISGNLWHDAGTAALMREHGIRRIYTRDVDFHRFRFLDVVDPTR